MKNTHIITPEAVLETCALKPTRIRCLVLQQLLAHEPNRQPVTAEKIHLELSHIGSPTGLSSVYRVLSTFESCGIVRRYRTKRDKSLYELISIDTQLSERAGLQIINTDNQSVALFYDPLFQQQLEALVHKQGYRLINQNIKIYVCPN